MGKIIGHGFWYKKETRISSFFRISVCLDEQKYNILMFTNKKQDSKNPTYYLKVKENGVYKIVGAGWYIRSKNDNDFVSIVLNLAQKKYKLLMFKRWDFDKVKSSDEHMFNLILKKEEK